MKFTKLTLAAAAACIALFETSALAQQFSFAYRVTDSRINVFDDGKNTRIQLPEGTLVPAVFTLKTQGQKLLDLKRDGNFLVADGLHQSLRLVWANGREATASFTGDSDADRLGVAVAFGSASPSQVFGSTSTPVATQAASPQERKQQASELQNLASAQPIPPLPALTITPDSAESPGPITRSTEPNPQHTANQPSATNIAQTAAVRAMTALPPKHKLPDSANFSIEPGQRLSSALTTWLQGQGIELVWDVSASGERIRDIEMISAWVAPSQDIEQTLAHLLPPFGLRALVQDSPRAVIVRAATGSTSKATTGVNSK